MDRFQLVICKCAFVLTLFACHQFLFIHLRQIIQINREESFNEKTSAQPSSGDSTKAFRPATPLKQSSNTTTNAFWPTTPPRHSSSASTNAFRLTTPSSSTSTKAFRPTTPPGPSSSASTNVFDLQIQVKAPVAAILLRVRMNMSRSGHCFASENEHVKNVNRPTDDRHFVTENKNDFRCTEPGNSPGVGHAVGKNAEPNA